MTESARNGAPEHGGGAARPPGRPRRPAAVPWLSDYRRAYLPLDLVAGVTLVAIAIPEQLATAHLAGMPVVAGLYAFLAAVVMFALLGANRTMSVGADSTIAPMLAVAVAAVAGAGSAAYGGDMALLALLVGALVIAVGVARMGWIADFLSAPVVTGFLAGIAVTIIVGQLPDVLGVPSTSGNALQKLVGTVQNIGDTNLYALAVAVAVFVVIVACERVSRRLPGRSSACSCRWPPRRPSTWQARASPPSAACPPACRRCRRRRSRPISSGGCCPAPWLCLSS